jgi:hypothetical protein
MVSYDYSKLYAACIENPSVTSIVVAERVATAKHFKVFSYIVDEISSSGFTTGWRSVWTKKKPVNEVVQAIYGKRCDINARKIAFLEEIASMSAANMVYGILTNDDEISLSPELFFLSWKSMNTAIVALYPSLILRLHSVGPRCDADCPFTTSSYDKLIRKKLASLHPLVRSFAGDRFSDKNTMDEIISYLKSIDSFSCIDRARLKVDLIHRSILDKGFVGIDEGEMGIVPISSVFKKSEEKVWVKPSIVDKDGWRDKLAEMNDCELVPHKAYSHVVEYLSREIRRRCALQHDYPFFINVACKQDVMNVVKRLEATSYGRTWIYCRWLAHNVTRESLTTTSHGKFDITKLLLSKESEFAASGTDPGSLMRARFHIFDHLEQIWSTEPGDRRFIFLSCIYGISVVCAYIQEYRQRVNKREDPNEVEIGLARIRKLDINSTSYKMIRKVTEKNVTGVSSMLRSEAMIAKLYGSNFPVKNKSEWDDGLADFIRVISSYNVSEV